MSKLLNPVKSVKIWVFLPSRNSQMVRDRQASFISSEATHHNPLYQMLLTHQRIQRLMIINNFVFISLGINLYTTSFNQLITLNRHECESKLNIPNDVQLYSQCRKQSIIKPPILDLIKSREISVVFTATPLIHSFFAHLRVTEVPFSIDTIHMPQIVRSPHILLLVSTIWMEVKLSIFETI